MYPPSPTNYGAYQGLPNGLPVPGQKQQQQPPSDPTNTTTNTPTTPQQPSGNILGTDLSQAGKVMSMMKPPTGGFDSAGNFIGKSTVSGASNIPSWLGGSTTGSILSKALPIAGGVTGIAGMIANKGPVSNILSGAGAGASIGSIVPGIGTLIGGGIGALAGGIEDLFQIGKPSQQELQGRQAQGNAISAINQYATPDEVKEAQGAVGHGWDNANDPLSMIVMRDQLQKQLAGPNGRTPQTDAQAESMAEQYMKGLWSAEKGGTQAVASAASPIQSLMNGYQTSQAPQSTFKPTMAPTTYGG